jgi:tRNA(Phe) wybutosine-synthesizing methylase Tyw3
MAYSAFSINRLCKASLFLVFFSSQTYAYTPPATAGVPQKFYLNSVAQADALYNSQCDSNRFSWAKHDYFCATGDPSNISCVVEMVYHSTDVNRCQSSNPNPDPDPNPNPDPDPNPNPNPNPIPDTGYPYAPTPGSLPHDTTERSNQNLVRSLATLFDVQRVTAIHGFTGVQWRLNEFRRELKSQTDQTNHILRDIETRLMSSYDNSPVVHAIKSFEGTFMSKMDQMPSKQFWQMRHELEDFNFDNRLGGISSELTGVSQLNSLANSMDRTLKDILAGGSGGGSSGPETDLRVLDAINTHSNKSTDLIDRLLTQVEYKANRKLESIDDGIWELIDAVNDKPSGGNSDVVTSNSCSSFVCSSDSTQCFIAKKQWEQSCKTSTDPNQEPDPNAEKLLTDIKAFVESPDSDIQNIDAGSVNTASLLTHYTNGNGFKVGGSSSCPAPYTVNVVITSFTLDLAPFCELASVIRWFLIAFSTVGAGLMIVKYS